MGGEVKRFPWGNGHIDIDLTEGRTRGRTGPRLQIIHPSEPLTPSYPDAGSLVKAFGVMEDYKFGYADGKLRPQVYFDAVLENPILTPGEVYRLYAKGPALTQEEKNEIEEHYARILEIRLKAG